MDLILVSEYILRNFSYFSIFCTAQPWTGSSDMIYQAELLIEKLKHEKLCDWNEDWKIVTLFVGVSCIR